MIRTEQFPELFDAQRDVEVISDADLKELVGADFEKRLDAIDEAFNNGELELPETLTDPTCQTKVAGYAEMNPKKTR